MLYKLYEWLKSLVHFRKGENTHRADSQSCSGPDLEVKWEDGRPVGYVPLTPRGLNLRRAMIVQERNKLKADLEKARRLKRKRRHIYAALEALRTEELRIEAGQ